MILQPDILVRGTSHRRHFIQTQILSEIVIALANEASEAAGARDSPAVNYVICNTFREWSSYEELQEYLMTLKISHKSLPKYRGQVERLLGTLRENGSFPNRISTMILQILISHKSSSY